LDLESIGLVLGSRAPFGDYVPLLCLLDSRATRP
jgi:hypothetical protein